MTQHSTSEVAVNHHIECLYEQRRPLPPLTMGLFGEMLKMLIHNKGCALKVTEMDA